MLFIAAQLAAPSDFLIKGVKNASFLKIPWYLKCWIVETEEW